MTIKEAIDKIYAPKGMTSVIAGISTGDFSVLNDQKNIEISHNKAKEMIKKYKKDLKNCKSDWSYWSILSDLSYWEAIENILHAGTLNKGILADVKAPDLQNCGVMDAISKVLQFGREVLAETKKNIE